MKKQNLKTKFCQLSVVSEHTHPLIQCKYLFKFKANVENQKLIMNIKLQRKRISDHRSVCQAPGRLDQFSGHWAHRLYQ